MKKTTLVLSLALLGCTCGPDSFDTPEETNEDWSYAHLIDKDPTSVTDEQLQERANALALNYWVYNQSYGILYPGAYGSEDYPSKFAGGGDSALFTGFALAAWCFRGSEENLWENSRRSLDGLYWLTHAAGDGVICRAVIPWDKRAQWDYPAAWQSRIDSGFSDVAVMIESPFSYWYPDCAYYTRATRDQLTGILFGLSVAWHFDQHRGVVRTIMNDLHDHLEKHDWKIRDQHGKNDTSADKVDGALRTQFLALYRLTTKGTPREGNVTDTYVRSFKVGSVINQTNVFNNYSQYYAHNLRAARAYSIWLLEDNEDRKKKAVEFVKNHVWKHTKNHKNAWFAVIYYHMSGGNGFAKTQYEYAIRSQYYKPLRGYGSPYGGQEQKPTLDQVVTGCSDKFVVDPHLRKMTNYFTWAKEPWDVGHIDKSGNLHESGLDFLLPYWLARYAGLHKE